MSDAALKASALFQNIRKIIYGKDDQIRLILCTWFAGGHILIEDFPGTGKTMLARAVARSVNIDFHRIQFTPDLLPSDITGSHVYNQKSSTFDFHKGPLLSTLVLADEINRATPRTQSALLEAMGEGQITVDGETHKLDPLFFVMATQNPVEQMGTFALPEAQLDRFLMKISMGYPAPQDEINMVKNQILKHPIHELAPVCSSQDLAKIRALVPQVKVSNQVYEYAVNLVLKSRAHKSLKLGASPRASIALVRAGQALAFLEGLDHVRPSHIFKLAHPVLDHRVILTTETKLEGRSAKTVVDEVIQQVSVPTT